MNETTVFTKTARGHDEIRNRTLKLSPALRMLLISVDGAKTQGSLAKEYPIAKGIGPLLTELLAKGLIETQVVKPGATSSNSAPDGFEHFHRATQFLNESTALLGMAGYFFSLKIQRCASLSDLRKLAPDFRDAVAQRRGQSDADDLMRRFHELID